MGLPTFLCFLKQKSMHDYKYIYVFFFFFPEKHRVIDLGYSRRSHSVHSFYSAERFSSEMTHQVPKVNTHLSDSGFLTLKPGSLWTVTMSFTLKCYMHPKSLQLCLTICDPMDCSPPGSSVHGILQARILEWVLCPWDSPGKNTGVGCRFLLQGIFPTQ